MNDPTTRERILETAVALFGKKGFFAVSTTDIARAAEVNKALIFYYFSSKEELYRTAITSRVEQFRDRIVAMFDETEPGLPTIDAFVRRQIEFYSTNQIVFRMVVHECLIDNNHKWDGCNVHFHEIAEILKPVREKMLATILYAIEKREIREVDPYQTMVNIISLNIFFFLGKPMIRMIAPPVDSEEFQQRRVDHVIDLLMNGLKRHSPENNR